MELHGQNHLANGVLSHRQHPTYHKGYENAVTWRTEASRKSYVVKPKGCDISFFNLAFPLPIRLFSKKRVRVERLVIQLLFSRVTILSYRKGETTANKDASRIRSGASAYSDQSS